MFADAAFAADDDVVVVVDPVAAAIFSPFMSPIHLHTDEEEDAN